MAGPKLDKPLELLAVWHGKYEAWILEQADQVDIDKAVSFE